MFGINGWEFLVLLLVAMIVIGPERLPEYTRQLRIWVLRGREMLQEGKQSIQSEVGGDVDWKQLDPRQYDPRKIVRDALNEPLPAPSPRKAEAAPEKAPFDPDAT